MTTLTGANHLFEPAINRREFLRAGALSLFSLGYVAEAARDALKAVGEAGPK
jgi:hypothetical protein